MNSIRMKRTRQTFTLPEDVFRRFAALVPGGQRSAVIAMLLEKETSRREQSLIQACEAANKESCLTQLEQDFQALEDTIGEPFDHHAW
jgi:hypothetical protein